MNSRSFKIVLVALLLLLLGQQVSYSVSSTPTIYACLKSGTLTQVQKTVPKCKSGSSPINWVQSPASVARFSAWVVDSKGTLLYPYERSNRGAFVDGFWLYARPEVSNGHAGIEIYTSDSEFGNVFGDQYDAKYFTELGCKGTTYLRAYGRIGDFALISLAPTDSNLYKVDLKVPQTQGLAIKSYLDGGTCKSDTEAWFMDRNGQTPDEVTVSPVVEVLEFANQRARIAAFEKFIPDGRIVFLVNK